MKRYAPATARNRAPILEVLRRVLPDGPVLEVASGSGEHALYFAAALAAERPALTWQPSDADPACLASIAAWLKDPGAPANVLPPIALDVLDPAARWPAAQAIVCINMIHIAPWPACLGLLDGAARILPPGGGLYLYGPYQVGGRHTAPSNAAFDADLRARDPAWGVRDVADVLREAAARGLHHVDTVPMPSNNLSLVLRRA